MESTGYSLPDPPPPEAESTDSGYRYADPEQIRESHSLSRLPTNADILGKYGLIRGIMIMYQD
jgi:hypothetical protein